MPSSASTTEVSDEATSKIHAFPAWWDWQERFIVTEEAEAESWQRLSTYTYEPNIKSYWDSHGLPHPSDDSVTDWIAGCFRQARAYFAAGKASPLDIRPVLFYYGTTTLLAGVTALIQAQEPAVTGHGMKLKGPNAPDRLVNVEVDLLQGSSGALEHFASCFSPECNLAQSGSWSLMEIFSSLPDLKADFELWSPRTKIFCHPVEPLRIGRVVVERLRIDDLRQAHGKEMAVLPLIHRATELYVPQWTEEYLSLFPKVGRWDAVRRAGWIGLDGRKYLQLGHQKGKQLLVPHLILFYLIGLYALGFLSRYRPQVWNPFVLSDATGERLVIEKFLSSAGRNIPNFALDFIYQCRIRFVAPGVGSRVPLFSAEDIQAEITAEVKKQIEAYKLQEGLSSNVSLIS